MSKSRSSNVIASEAKQSKSHQLHKKIATSGYALLAITMTVLLSITPAYAATSTTNHIKINIYDSTNLDTMLETCESIKADQEKNHTYTEETYNKLMEACEEGLSTLECLETANDASECDNPDENADDIDDAINNLKTPDKKPTPPNTDVGSTWEFKLLGRDYAIPAFPFIFLSCATILTIILAVYLIRKRIREEGIGGIKVKNPWDKDNYSLTYEKTLASKHKGDPLTEIIDVSQIVRKYRIKFVLWHAVPVVAIVIAFFTLLLTTAPTKAEIAIPTLDETAIAAVNDVIINIDKKNETADPIRKTATVTTTVTTENETGYTLTAKHHTDQDTYDALAAGITVKLNAENLTTTAVEIYASNDDTSPDVQNHALVLNMPISIPTGTHGLTIVYEIEDNEPPMAPISCAPNGYYNGSNWIQYNGTDHGYIGTMQSKTSASFAGWNIGDYATVTDNRNNQDYVVCKLADEHVWMLNNLKLGSTTGTIPLTPANTNIASNWTLPQIDNSATTSSDTPVVYSYWDDPSLNGGNDPTKGSDIRSDEFYGYHYNWCAATAGGTASGRSNTCTSFDVYPEDATGDICPVNWRLPTGGSTGEFAWLNAKMNNPATSSPSSSSGSGYYENWQTTGQFRGVFSGYRYDYSSWTWHNQGWGGFWWSSSHDLGTPADAFRSWFYSLSVAPSYSTPRYSGLAVRCLVK